MLQTAVNVVAYKRLVRRCLQIFNDASLVGLEQPFTKR